MSTLAIVTILAALAAAAPGDPATESPPADVEGRPRIESVLPLSPPVAYRSWLHPQEEGLLRLANGAAVRLAGPRPERILSGADVILFRTGGPWRIWIEDLGTFGCRLVEPPAWHADGEPALLTTIDLVAGRGAVLITLDGMVFDVDRFDVHVTEDWLPGAHLLLVGDGEAVNLAGGDDPVELVRLR